MKKSSDPLVAGLAGAIGGGVEATFTWPTELAKTHLQLQASGKKLSGHPHYAGILDCWKQTVKRSGVVGLYRGLTPIVLMSFPKAGVRFAGFTTYRKFWQDKDGNMSGWRNFACGLCAGATEAVLVVTPQETLKVKLMDADVGFVRGTADIIKKEGIGGIYKGLVPTIGKQASNQGIRFLAFTEYVELLCGNLYVASPSPCSDPDHRACRYKKRVLKYTGSDNLTSFQSLVGGMTAGCCSVLGNNPIDTVKTRMQGFGASQYSGTMDCVMSTLRNEGVRGFYKGAIARMGRVVPGQGVLFLTFETITQMVEKALKKREDEQRM